MTWGGRRNTNTLDAVRAAAADLIGRGYAVCALDPDEKKPTYPEWPILLLTPDAFAAGDGIGIMAGPVSGRAGHALVVVDLDSPAAVELGDRHLPPTAMEEGRPGKPRSHRGYMVPLETIPADERSTARMAGTASAEQYGHPGPKIRHYARTLDLIGTGGQVACPPTRHASGELRAWVGGTPGEPAVVAYPDLLGGVKNLLTACGYEPATKARVAAPHPRVRVGQGGAGGRSPAHDDDTATVPVDAALRGRIHRYLDAEAPAVSGSGGHGRTYAVACALVWGFALDAGTALEFLSRRYNPRCRPPWTPDELRHKVASAATATTHWRPRGRLRRVRPKKSKTTITTPWTSV